MGTVRLYKANTNEIEHVKVFTQWISRNEKTNDLHTHIHTHRQPVVDYKENLFLIRTLTKSRLPAPYRDSLPLWINITRKKKNLHTYSILIWIDGINKSLIMSRITWKLSRKTLYEDWGWREKRGKVTSLHLRDVNMQMPFFCDSTSNLLMMK